MAEAAFERILAGQERWAQRHELERLESGHTASLDGNFFSPLSSKTRTELAAAGRGLLGDGDKPGEVQLLHSALALACNVFDPHRSSLREIGAACDAGETVTELHFAPPGSADAAGTSGPPALDLRLAGAAMHPAGVLVDYAEPYQSASRTPRAGEAPPFGARHASLPGCTNLARDLTANPRRFGRLPVARLLAAAGALTSLHGPRGSRLLYIWYDAGGPEARQLQREIDRFRMRVGGEIDFAARSWQRVIASLASRAERGVLEQVAYLRERYL